MHKREDFHHTPEQVGQALRQALKLADTADLIDADRAALLPVMLTQLLSKQIFYEQVGPMPGLALPPNARH